MTNIIHERRCGCHGTATELYLDSQDRGPKGETGERGEKGDPGEKGNDGASIAKLYINEHEHLIAELSDGSTFDAGEMPKVITKRVFSIVIDGSTNLISLTKEGLPVEVNQKRISHILINGVTYTEEFEIIDGMLKLNFADNKIPAGKLEIFTNSHGCIVENGGAVTSVNGKVGDVEINVNIESISDGEIIKIINPEEEQNGNINH